MPPKSRYHNLRKKPSPLKLVFILESPPVSGKYFYDPTGKTTEPLFAAMMKVIRENPAILDDLPELIKDLNRNLPDRGIPVILIKANICRLLKKPLKARGFNVINEDEIIPFPSNGWQPIFHHRLQDLFSKRKIRL